MSSPPSTNFMSTTIKKSFLSIVALSLLVFFAIGCGDFLSASNLELQEGYLELQEGWKINPGEYYTTITGTISNKGGDLSYAQISFSLLDSSGAQVGSAFANVNNLRAGMNWKFEAMCLADNWLTARVESIEGW